MPNTFTAVYNLIKMAVGGDTDMWGDDHNKNMDAIDAAMKVNADAVAAAAKSATDAAAAAAANAAALAALVTVPVGTVIFGLSDQLPAGFVKANGSLLSRVTYPGLYTYANAAQDRQTTEANWAANPACFTPGDGATNFRIPDLRGEFPRFFDGGRGIDTGRNLALVQMDDIKPHYHPTSQGASYFITIYAAIGPAYVAYDYTNGTFGYDKLIPNGGNGASETRPRNVAFVPFLKY